MVTHLVITLSQNPASRLAFLSNRRSSNEDEAHFNQSKTSLCVYPTTPEALHDCTYCWEH